MKTSESQERLVSALFKAKQAFPKISKNKKGQSGNRTFNYAPLDVILDAVDPVLYSHELMITQGTEGHELVTRLEHISGQWREIRMPVNAEHANMQSYGIEVTYRRRYSVQLILGIVTEEDLDIKEKNRAKGMDHTGGERKERTGVAADVLKVSPQIPDARKEELASLAESVIEDFNAYGAGAAFERIQEWGLDDTEKVYLSTFMAPNIRNKIKEHSIKFHNSKVSA